MLLHVPECGGTTNSHGVAAEANQIEVAGVYLWRRLDPE